MKTNELIEQWNELKRMNFRFVDYERLEPEQVGEIRTRLGEGYKYPLGRDIARKNYEKILELNEHHKTYLRNVRPGGFFRLVPNGPVWVRDEYDRSERKYIAYKFDDVNYFKMIKGDRIVYIGFTF